MLLTSPAKPQILGTPNVVLATHSFSLEDRYGNTFVNDVFKDNILLTLAYMDGSVKAKGDISWDKVSPLSATNLPFCPGRNLLSMIRLYPIYKGDVVKTTNAHFNWNDGFKSRRIFNRRRRVPFGLTYLLDSQRCGFKRSMHPPTIILPKFRTFPKNMAWLFMTFPALLKPVLCKIFTSPIISINL